MKAHIPKQAILIGTVVLLLVGAGAATAIATRTHSPGTKPTSTTHATASRAPTQHAATHSSTVDQKPVTQTTDPTPAGLACQLLTRSVAQQVLGSNATTSPSGDISSLASNDTTLSVCSYASNTSGVQLIVRIPTDSLGVSKNATMFGSAKPQNATTLQGYGQSAYWDNDKHQLNVLDHNNWYIIARSTGTQADAEAVAKALAGKL